VSSETPAAILSPKYTLNCCQSNTPHADQRGGVSEAHYHLKAYALKRRVENRAVFDQVKLVLVNTKENF